MMIFISFVKGSDPSRTLRCCSCHWCLELSPSGIIHLIDKKVPPQESKSLKKNIKSESKIEKKRYLLLHLERESAMFHK